jgi:hypothetical protein
MIEDSGETVRIGLVLRASMRRRIQTYRQKNDAIMSEMDAIRRLLEIALESVESS